MAATAGSDELELLTYRDERQHFVPADAAVACLAFPGLTRSPVLDIAWHQGALGTLALARRYDVLFLPAANRRLAASN